MSKEFKHIFITYIKSDKAKVWQALTSGKFTKKYYFGSELISELKTGSEIKYLVLDDKGNETTPVIGKITKIEPYKKLVHTFHFHGNKDKHSRVTYEIEEIEGLVKLTLTHDQFENETETYKSVAEGWPFILSGLKTLLETGKNIKK